MSADPVSAPAGPVAPGGERKVLAWVLGLGIAGAAWFLWLMVESGQDLNLRSKVLALIKLAESPQGAAELAKARGANPHLADFSIDPGGAVRLRLKGAPDLEGRTVALIPQSVDGKVVGWRCASDAPRKFLPRQCEVQ